jgi:hypothetical protein
MHNVRSWTHCKLTIWTYATRFCIHAPHTLFPFIGCLMIGDREYKSKVKLFPCLLKQHAMKSYRTLGVQLYVFIFSAVDGSEWLPLRPNRYTLGERAPSTYWTGGWVGPEQIWTPWRKEIRNLGTCNSSPVFRYPLLLQVFSRSLI